MHGVLVVRRFLKGGADFCSRGKESEQLFSVELKGRLACK